ncbi:MAG: hypothetical protein ABJF86_09850 [Tateyamaria sp.]|uniref:hypothetical protein n=1 Tax=Tateyamaria sp. TaxID=1929288 RepID=UPI00328E5EE0
MIGYFTWFQQSMLYGRYLKVRAWSWRVAPKLSIFSIFLVVIPLIFWWVVVPGAIFFLLLFATLSLGALPSITVTYSILVLSLLMILPITVSVFLDFFPAYFAVIALTFGRFGPAERMRKKAEYELDVWKSTT